MVQYWCSTGAIKPNSEHIILKFTHKTIHLCYFTEFSNTFIFLWLSRGRSPGFLVPVLLYGPISFFYSRKTAHLWGFVERLWEAMTRPVSGHSNWLRNMASAKSRGHNRKTEEAPRLVPKRTLCMAAASTGRLGLRFRVLYLQKNSFS